MNSEEHAPNTKPRQLSASARYLAFSLRTEQFAIPLLEVKEVIGVTEATAVPQMPPYFKGIINLRGQIISVIDLRVRLQLPKGTDGPETSIIILDLGSVSIGVIVDSINSVLAIAPEELSNAPDGTGLKDQYVKGVARKDNKLTLILDIAAVLSINDLNSIKQSQKRAA